MKELNINYIKESYIEGSVEMTNVIKAMLYKKDNSIFDKVDFENSKLFKDPLIFAYFNNEKEYNIDWLLFGYMNTDTTSKSIFLKSDTEGRIYISNFGWIITNYSNSDFVLKRDSQGNLLLMNNSKIVEFNTEHIHKSFDGKIELLPYNVSLLNKCFYNTDSKLINVEVTEIYELRKKELQLAIKILSELLPEYYELITLSTSKIIIFNVDTFLSNSFATIGAQGLAFLNAYQDDYNEVFFLDDIVHQSGHLIMNCIIFDKTKYFKVDSNTIIQNVYCENGDLYETRNIEVLFHALYTYYATFLMINECLDKNIFTGLKKHELLGRLSFYLNKCYSDFSLIEIPSVKRNKVDKLYDSISLFTKDGFILYDGMKKKYKKIHNKWHEGIDKFDLSNQPYNFTFSKFLELNPLKKEIC